jgi:hypothetical protein
MKKKWNTSSKIEGKKITDQQTIFKTFNVYFVAITENVKKTKKNIDINDVMFIWIVTPIS